MCEPEMVGMKRLYNGYEMPEIGLGTWQMKNEDELIPALESAYELGYRLIDTAYIYRNEKIIGKFLRNKKREELFITSKLWHTDYKDVRNACMRTLSDLQIEYLDLYLIHWPIHLDTEERVVELWRQMESLVEEKLVRSIGVSNFTQKELEMVLKNARIKPAVNQIEVHPYWSQDDVRMYCEKNGICVTSYSSLGSSGNVHNNPQNNPIVERIAKRHGVSPSSVLLRYALMLGCAVIPRSKSKDHQRENLSPVEITEEEFKEIDEIPDRTRIVPPPV